MNSTKTKTNSYVLINRKAVTATLFLAKGGLFRVYVVWEWEDLARKQIFAIMKSTGLHDHITDETINQVADYGSDITDTPEAKQLFPYLFK